MLRALGSLPFVVVATARVGQRTDFDKLTMQIETNGALSPEDAL